MHPLKRCRWQQFSVLRGFTDMLSYEERCDRNSTKLCCIFKDVAKCHDTVT